MTDQYTFIVKVLGEGEPIILIPGLMSNGSIYEELALALSKQYQVHIISVKGFAGTPKSGNFSLNQFVEDIAAYIESEKLNKPSIIGHSMGGLAAFKLAIEHSNVIGRIVSIDGLPFIGPIFTHNNAITADMLMPQAQSFKTLFASMNPHQMAAQAQMGVYIQATSAADQARIVEMAKTSDPVTSGNAMYDVMSTDLREALKQTTTPILMLGASGGFTHNSQHKQVESLYTAQFSDVKTAKVVMNTKARHFIMLDDLTWLREQIEQFLANG